MPTYHDPCQKIYRFVSNVFSSGGASPTQQVSPTQASHAQLESRKTNRHEDAAYANVWAEPLAYPRALPEDARDTVLVPVHDAREEVVHVGACADVKEDDEEE